MNESNNGTVLSTNNSLSFDLGVTLSIAIGFTILSGVAAMLLRYMDPEDDDGRRFKDIVMRLASIFVLILDITTDIVMTWVYWVDGNSENFCLSLTFTVLPTLANIIAMIFGFVELGSFKCNRSLIFFVCSPVLLYVVYTWSLATRPNQDQPDQDRFKSILWLAYILGLIETTFESAPQIIVQIYINLKNTIDEESSSRYFRYFTVAASVLGIAMSMYNFKHGVRHFYREDPLLSSKIFSWLSSIAEIGPRVVILAVFVYVARIYCVIFFVTHATIFIVFVIIAVRTGRQNGISQPTSFNSHEMMTLLLGSFATMFFFFNYKFLDRVDDESAIKFRKAFYILFYIENAILLAIYVILTNDRNVWYFGGTILAVIVGFASHLVVHVVYIYLKTDEERRRYKSVWDPIINCLKKRNVQNRGENDYLNRNMVYEGDQDS